MNVKTLVSSEAIQERIEELAKEIKTDYEDKEVVLVGILKGSFIFLADLARALWNEGLKDYEIDFMGISSYGQDTESSRNPKITMDLSMNIENRHVLIVEDIVDTGYSLDTLLRLLEQRMPASVKCVSLLSKQSGREVEVPVDYVGFEVDGWVEGYGLDSREKNRGRDEVVVIGG